MPPDPGAVKEWVELAAEDLRAGAVALAAHPPLIRDACFHSQQAVEKALKAFLTWRETRFDWSHDVEYLVQLCIAREPRFEEWETAVAPLTDYASRLRYPFPGPPPTADQAREALDVAERVYRFVLAHLPPDTHPPSPEG